MLHHIHSFNALLGAWRCISPSWISTSTASGWTLCWNMPRTPRRLMRMRTTGATTRWTTPATCWHSTATKSTSVCSSPSTLGKTLTVSHLRKKGALPWGGRGPAPVTTTRHADPTDPAAYPPCRSTTNWTAWGCGWKGSWRALCLATTSPPGQVSTRSPLLNRWRRDRKDLVFIYCHTPLVYCWS